MGPLSTQSHALGRRDFCCVIRIHRVAYQPRLFGRLLSAKHCQASAWTTNGVPNAVPRSPTPMGSNPRQSRMCNPKVGRRVRGIPVRVVPTTGAKRIRPLLGPFRGMVSSTPAKEEPATGPGGPLPTIRCPFCRSRPTLSPSARGRRQRRGSKLRRSGKQDFFGASLGGSFERGPGGGRGSRGWAIANGYGENNRSPSRERVGT